MSGLVATVDGLREQVALASRIVAAEGYADLTLGHLSARVPGEDVILIKRKGIALDEVEPDDVVEVRLDGRQPDGGGTEIHLETVLHTEVYRARADVGAVVHGHPLYATALAATDAPLEPLTHDAVLFHEGLGRYGDSADLITAPEQGAAVARALGPRRAVLMRNHGVVVVGRDVPWAVVAAATLERASRVQAIARALGRTRPLTSESAARLAPLKYRDPFVEEYWEAWIRRIRRNGGDGWRSSSG